jgi:hypothetical protein
MSTETPASEVKPNPNPDLITGEPGSHPVATAAGAVAVCAAGAALGSMAGPVGTAIGGVAGAIAGGLGGNVLGETIAPTVEDPSPTLVEESYATGGHPYGKFIPSYRAEYEGYRHYYVTTPGVDEDGADPRPEGKDSKLEPQNASATNAENAPGAEPGRRIS